MTDLFLQPLFTWRSAVASKNGPPNPTTRHVLLTLGLHMSEKGDSCFPSTRLLAEESGLSHKAVITHLATAAETGWLGKREKRLSNGQGWRRIEYFALIPAAAMFHANQRDEGGSPRKADEPRSPPAQESSERGERQSEGDERRSKGDEPDAIPLTRSTSKSTSREEDRSTPIPEDFALTSELRAWADKKGWTPYIEAHFEHFIDHVKSGSKGKPIRYIDWNAAFRKSVAGDWGNIRSNLMRQGLKPTATSSTTAAICSYDTGRGEKCGMPAGRDGLCDHHRTKRREEVANRSMPAGTKAQLDALLKRSHA